MIFVQQVTRLRAGQRTTRGGDTVSDWTAEPEALVISGLSVQPATQNESSLERADYRETRYRLYSEPGTVPDITSLDRIVFEGETYEVDGEVALWPDPFTGQHHIEATIRRGEGG